MRTLILSMEVTCGIRKEGPTFKVTCELGIVQWAEIYL